MTTNSTFFEESQDQSLVKSAIVSKYFDAWASVIINTQKKFRTKNNSKIAYIDLFSGPGIYEDGTKSTPILILEKAINNIDIRERLLTIFNDKNKNFVQLLEKTINQLSGISNLKFKPKFYTEEVGDRMIEIFEQVNLVPTLFFVDPWGYKGLSLRLINSVLKDWGSDCIFFFNYRRINMGLQNLIFKEHMDVLFGEERAEKLRIKLGRLSVNIREMSIIEEMCQALKDLGAKFVLPFRFKDQRGTRTSHHLIFASKDFKGYDIMKDVMTKFCSSQNQGVPSFEYNPIDAKFKEQQPFLFQLSQPLDDLEEMLLKELAGQKLTMDEIYRKHSVDRPYIKKNYKDVLQKLEQEKKISTSNHRKNSFGNNVEVTFPSIKI